MRYVEGVRKKRDQLGRCAEEWNLYIVGRDMQKGRRGRTADKPRAYNLVVDVVLSKSVKSGEKCEKDSWERRAGHELCCSLTIFLDARSWCGSNMWHAFPANP